MGHGDTVSARQLDFGVGAGGGRHFALAAIDQAQFRVTKLRTLLRVRLGAVLEVALERLTQGVGSLLVQGRQEVDGLLGGFYGNKGFSSSGHDEHPV
ncbi:hypothetical protein D3C86_1611640 [compost metagenome]